MTDDRISRLEHENQQRAVEHARLSTSVEHLTDSVVKLTETMEGVSALMNRGRGAAWAFVFMGGLIGGGIAALVTKWLGD